MEFFCFINLKCKTNQNKQSLYEDKHVASQSQQSHSKCDIPIRFNTAKGFVFTLFIFSSRTKSPVQSSVYVCLYLHQHTYFNECV